MWAPGLTAWSERGEEALAARDATPITHAIYASKVIYLPFSKTFYLELIPKYNTSIKYVCKMYAN